MSNTNYEATNHTIWAWRYWRLGCYFKLWPSAACAAFPTVHQSTLGNNRIWAQK